MNELFINFAYLVWSFDFECARDEEGREILPDPDALEDTMVVASVLAVCHETKMD